ncbi:MAG: glycosyltransferase [Actinobacteria bacterium]|nr:glycosyltransferase [Actinomycetota bacterium]
MTTQLGTAAAPSRPLADTPILRRPALLAPVAPPHAGPRPQADGPRPHVDGKFLAVGAERLWLAGVTYGTFAPAEDGAPYPGRAQVDADLAAMAANGINALRTYTVPPRWLLDAALRHGLWVTVGLPWEQHVAFLDSRRRAAAIEARVRAGVAACAGHPALLGFLVGNEIPASIVRWHGRRAVERFVERLRRAAKLEDPGALVSYASFPSTEYLELPGLDYVSYNVYLEDPAKLAAYLARLQNRAGERPLVISELGLDSRRHGREAQARALREQVRASFAGGCAGTFLFAWTDAWHTGGAEVTDWDFGLVDRARRPKPALAAARGAYARLPLGDTRAARRARVSVVVCSCNGAATIGETLDAIARLDYPDYETIVVDDGSTDDTARIAAARPGVRLISTPNRGLSAARNVGMEAASGELVAYIDDDAYPDPQWLDYVALALRDGVHAGVGGPNLPIPSDGLVAECVANAPGGPVHVLLSDTVAEHIPGCNMAFRRDRLMAIGGFDPRYRVAGDDVDVCWRIQERGWTLGFHPAAVVWHHRRGSVRRFWRQQRGYGRAEALLEHTWPEKYNTPGHLAWGGRIYGRGSVPLRRQRVYYGQFGGGAFQPGIERPQPLLVALAGAPEWWLVVAGLAATSALGLLARPLLAALPLLALALALPLWQALATARRCDVRDRPPHRRLAGGALTALLVLLQPAARLAGRVERGLTPWRRGCRRGFRLPRPRVVSAWHERWCTLTEHVAVLEDGLRAGGLRVRRGGGCERWELHTAAGAFGGVRVRAAVEEHGRGRQLVRVRLQPCLPRLGRLALGGLATCAAAASAFEEWATAALAGAPLTLLLACATFECGAATAVALRAVRGTEEDRS